jgi:hypothetical protein
MRQKVGLLILPEEIHEQYFSRRILLFPEKEAKSVVPLRGRLH